MKSGLMPTTGKRVVYSNFAPGTLPVSYQSLQQRQYVLRRKRDRNHRSPSFLDTLVGISYVRSHYILVDTQIRNIPAEKTKTRA